MSVIKIDEKKSRVKFMNMEQHIFDVAYESDLSYLSPFSIKNY